jgi:3-hydroxybutyryl-CoA dehydrogenase
MDRVGLDVVLDIERRYAAESGDPDDDPPALLVELVERGMLGVKSGRGFYEYGVED